jgi:hypothetical protein
LLVNGLAGVSLTSSLGGNLGVGGASLRDPRDPRGVLVIERERQQRERENNEREGISISTSGGTSGGSGNGLQHSGSRNFNMGAYDQEPMSATTTRSDGSRGQVVPTRQPRGPDSDRAPGFASRRGQHHGRGSGGELDVQSSAEIAVE